MKAKLGKLKLIEKTQYAGFQSLLKKEITAVLENPMLQGMSKFVVLTGEALNWKCGGQTEDKPLLFLSSDYNSLVKDIKGDKDFDLKKYAYGDCKVTEADGKVTIYIKKTKGKLTDPALLKPLTKIFKKFKPKVFLEVVEDLTLLVGGATEEEEPQKIQEPLETQKTDKTDKTDKTGKTVKLLASDYKVILAEFKEIEKADHDTNLVKTLYKKLIIWGREFKQKDAAAQEKLEKFHKSYTATLNKVKKVMKADQHIDLDFKKIMELTGNYIEIEDHQSAAAIKVHDEAIVLLDKIIKYCDFIGDNAFKTECQSLKEVFAA